MAKMNTLGYTEGSIVRFCAALVSYNLMSVIKAALRCSCVYTVEEKASGYHLATEVTMTHRAMMIVIPEDEWAAFHKLTPVEMAGVSDRSWR